MRHKTVHKRENLYLFLAIGYLCVSINLTINGMGILLPTFVGYFIIARTSYALRFKNKAFLYATVPSAIMTALTFPQMTVELVRTDAYKYLFFPTLVLGYFILIVHCFGMYKCAVLDSLGQVKAAIIGVLCLIPVSFILWYLSETLGIPKAVYFMIYESPKFFFALVCYLCFKKSDR
jgi:hypothetical protein